jgi:hypothetical protein
VRQENHRQKKIGRENIIVVASEEKLASPDGKPLLVDTESEEVDKMLSGYMKVITGYEDYVVYKVGTLGTMEQKIEQHEKLRSEDSKELIRRFEDFLSAFGENCTSILENA